MPKKDTYDVPRFEAQELCMAVWALGKIIGRNASDFLRGEGKCVQDAENDPFSWHIQGNTPLLSPAPLKGQHVEVFSNVLFGTRWGVPFMPPF